LKCSEKTPELKDKLTMLVMEGRSAGRHCFRILDDCEMSLQISSLEAGLKKVKLVGSM